MSQLRVVLSGLLALVCSQPALAIDRAAVITAENQAKAACWESSTVDEPVHCHNGVTRAVARAWNESNVTIAIGSAHTDCVRDNSGNTQAQIDCSEGVRLFGVFYQDALRRSGR